MALTQDNRRAQIATPLGDNVLLLKRLRASEGLSRLFQFDVDLLSEDANIELDSLLGENVSIRVTVKDGEERFLNGFVSDFSYTGHDGMLASYRAVIHPWTWFLTQSVDSRIFQKLSVPDIVRDVFDANGFSDFEFRLRGQYDAHEYVVQYGESDFNFVSRLLEREGIYYFFEHENGRHMLVLADDVDAHAPYPGYEHVPFLHEDDYRHVRPEHLNKWALGQTVTSGSYTLRSFDFERPKADMEVRRRDPAQHSASEFAIYDYSENYVDSNLGDRYVRLRMETEVARRAEVHGSGDVLGFCPGFLFNLEDHPRDDQNQQFLVVASTLNLVNQDYETSGKDGGGDHSCEVTAIEASVVYRPSRSTPRPRMSGPQTAIVTGPSGEEIHTDEHGRVKVQFHWDRKGQYDQDSSCWVRVSQAWAGKGWGGVTIPRIGQEVIIDFIEGDPDRPIITGRFYNGDNKPPYELPGEAVVSGFKSDSHKGSGYNEFSMNDTKGQEKIVVHAQYDMETTVEHDQTDVVHNNRTTTVDVDDKESVGSNQSIDVGANQEESIGGDHTRSVGGNQSISVGGNRDLSIGGNQSFSVAGNNSLSANGNVSIDAMGNVSITAVGTITLSTGGSKIELTPGSINISSPTISINGQAKTDVSGAIVNVTGSGMVALTGGMVKVN